MQEAFAMLGRLPEQGWSKRLLVRMGFEHPRCGCAQLADSPDASPVAIGWVPFLFCASIAMVGNLLLPGSSFSRWRASRIHVTGGPMAGKLSSCIDHSVAGISQIA
jgi:hypothetical protein